MKLRRLFFLLLLILSIVFFSCSQDPTQTKEECVSGFFSSAKKGDFAAMKDYVHPSNDNYPTMNSAYFETAFLNGVGGVASNISASISNKSGNTFEVFVTYGDSATGTETFEFLEDGSDFWKIESFTTDDGVTQH